MVLEDTVAERAQALRAFSRFYTAIIGALREGLLETSYSLTEARVIFELGRQESIDVADLRTALGLDAGYLSRIRARLKDEGLVTRGTSGDDRRRHVIGLTAKGRAEFDLLDARSAEQAEAFIGRLAEDDQRSLVASFATVERLLGGSAGDGIMLREPRPGDLGWVVERHGALYAAEYGWDATFEALVAGIVAGFAARADTPSERAWIADAGGTRAGSILCRRSAAMAWAAGWSTSAWPSPARPDTPASSSGPTTCWSTPAASTSERGSRSTRRTGTRASATTSSARCGRGGSRWASPPRCGGAPPPGTPERRDPDRRPRGARRTSTRRP